MKANAGRQMCNFLKSGKEIQKNKQKQNSCLNCFGLVADIYGYMMAHVRQWESTRCLRVFAFSTASTLTENPPERTCKLPFFHDIDLMFGFFNSPTFSSNNVWSLTWEKSQKQHQGNRETWAGARLKWRGEKSRKDSRSESDREKMRARESERDG